jgi:phytoene dehydrogenase-like protein
VIPRRRAWCSHAVGSGTNDGVCDRSAVVVGSGPNGLAAAITVAQAGYRVVVREAAATIGGGVRSAELTLPGYTHDVCSAVHPLAVASPFFRRLELARHGLVWIEPPAPLAHPFDDGGVALLERSLDAMGATLGADAAAWRRLFAPLARDWDAIVADVLGRFGLPRHPLATARFGTLAIRSAAGLATARFRGARARALFAGIAAHAPIPLDGIGSAAMGLVLATAGHAVGWPFPRGGAGALAEALAGCLRDAGGDVVCGMAVDDLAELGPVPFVLLDLVPRDVVRVGARRLPSRYVARLSRWRHGPGAFKLDWALREPIPWRNPACARAGTVHLGGSLEEIAASERAAWRGEHAERPFVLLVQPTLFDPTRAPPGRHVAWAYCHVPHGSTVDATARIEAQVERFAPGFRDVILERAVSSPRALEQRNPNLVGGDVNGGALDLAQLLARPILAVDPHRTPLRGLYLCSSATWPGPGVHGMCGHLAALAALRDATRPPREAVTVVRH